jgi:hypothetical protein
MWSFFLGVVIGILISLIALACFVIWVMSLIEVDEESGDME